MSEHETESHALSKGPCECGSSDGCVTYSDGHTHCFVCQRHTGPSGQERAAPTHRMSGNLITEVEYTSLSKRGLNEETCRHWRYGIGTYNGKPCQVANYYDPDGTKVVAQKVRTPGKEFVILGDIKQAGLYGQHLWRDGGKMVVVTEGEIDALSVSQLQSLKWAVVSIPTGAAGAKKAIGKAVDWLEKFESVVLMFDNDEPGIAAAKECSEMLSPGKAKIARLPLKDANEMLKAGRGAEVIKAMWDAKVHRPDGIVAGTDVWDRIMTEEVNEAIPLPYTKLQAMTRGMRLGELVTFTSGSGMGKTEVVRQIYNYFHEAHDDVLGLIHLEEPLKRTCLGMMGLYLNKRIHLDRSLATEEEMKEAYLHTIGSGRVFLYEHFGSTESENLFNRIRYFVKGCGCKTIVLDHISIVVSGMEDGDERRIIDNLMTKLATMAQELNCRIIIISHLKKADGTPHEEGGRVTMDALRGSASIKQLSHTIIALERNQQDETRKHLTLLRVLKCRFTGETGEADWLKYDTETGRLNETLPEFDTPAEESQPFEKNDDF